MPSLSFRRVPSKCFIGPMLLETWPLTIIVLSQKAWILPSSAHRWLSLALFSHYLSLNFLVKRCTCCSSSFHVFLFALVGWQKLLLWVLFFSAIISEISAPFSSNQSYSFLTSEVHSHATLYPDMKLFS